MRLTWKDAAATILVAAIVIPYIGYLIRGEMSFIKDPRGMAGAALILGFAACAVGASEVRGSQVFVKISSAFGFVALGLGIATLITKNEPLLAGFIATIVLLWTMATIRLAVSRRTAPDPPPATAARGRGVTDLLAVAGDEGPSTSRR